MNHSVSSQTVSLPIYANIWRLMIWDASADFRSGTEIIFTWGSSVITTMFHNITTSWLNDKDCVWSHCLLVSAWTLYWTRLDFSGQKQTRLNMTAGLHRDHNTQWTYNKRTSVFNAVSSCIRRHFGSMKIKSWFSLCLPCVETVLLFLVCTIDLLLRKCHSLYWTRFQGHFNILFEFSEGSAFRHWTALEETQVGLHDTMQLPKSVGPDNKQIVSKAPKPGQRRLYHTYLCCYDWLCYNIP